MGLEMKELVILLIGFFAIFTFLKDMVHGILTIPFIMMASLLLLWLVMPSRNNPIQRNYMSLILFYKRDKQIYHAMCHHKMNNEKIHQLEEER